MIFNDTLQVDLKFVCLLYRHLIGVLFKVCAFVNELVNPLIYRFECGIKCRQRSTDSLPALLSPNITCAPRNSLIHNYASAILILYALYYLFNLLVQTFT